MGRRPSDRNQCRDTNTDAPLEDKGKGRTGVAPCGTAHTGTWVDHRVRGPNDAEAFQSDGEAT